MYCTVNLYSAVKNDSTILPNSSLLYCTTVNKNFSEVPLDIFFYSLFRWHEY